MTTLQALRLVRTFDASPERLFDAWTDPAVVAGWLFTTPASEAHHVALDLRVGGGWEIVDRRDGTDYRAIGAYLEIEPPRRLVFTFGMPQFSDAFSQVTVEIEADGAGARMTLIQAQLPPDAIPALEQGWREMFDQLAKVISAKRAVNGLT
jgi:uncharacterized protein YndB with AHSA1/START domain